MISPEAIRLHALGVADPEPARPKRMDMLIADEQDFEAMLRANMAVSDEARRYQISAERFQRVARRYWTAYRATALVACGAGAAGLILGGLLCR